VGAGTVRVGHRLHTFQQHQNSVEATFVDRRGRIVDTVAADVLLGADGIHSTVRCFYHPAEGPPRWNGWMMWRGATPWPRFLDGRTMIIAGGLAGKIVVYPIAATASNEMLLTNWALVVPLAEPGTQPPRREDWSRPARRADLVPHLEGLRSDVIDFQGLVDATSDIFEYPMCDRDPLPSWTRGRVTLLGDAAHPMYPMGSNGATQAIIDGRSLATHLAGAVPEAALQAFDVERRPVTTRLVELNRIGGPERVLDLIERMAPDGFDDIDDVVAPDELRRIIQDYAKATRGHRGAPGPC
jgi:2-polyprenyl-6-methoxyphenol hydroxylase-like FAD-dependent oxidoreductase